MCIKVGNPSVAPVTISVPTMFVSNASGCVVPKSKASGSLQYSCWHVLCQIKVSAVARERWSPRQVIHLPPVWDILLPLAYTPGRRDQRLLVSLPKDTDKVG